MNVRKRMTSHSLFRFAFGMALGSIPILLRAAPPDSEKPSDAHELFVRLALKGIAQEFPNKPEHVLAGPDDLKSPKALHPAFYGSYDWHSSVHGHWMLAHLLRTKPDLPVAKTIRAIFNDHLTPEKIRIEAAYFERPLSRSFVEFLYSQGTDRVMPTEEKYFLHLPLSAEAMLLASVFFGSLASAFFVSVFATFLSSSFLSLASAVLFGVDVAGCSGSA